MKLIIRSTAATLRRLSLVTGSAIGAILGLSTPLAAAPMFGAVPAPHNPLSGMGPTPFLVVAGIVFAAVGSGLYFLERPTRNRPSSEDYLDRVLEADTNGARLHPKLKSRRYGSVR